MSYNNVSSYIVAIARNSPNGANLLGTGFIVGNGLIATTKHVTNADDNNLSIILPKYRINDYQDTSDGSVEILKASIEHVDSIKDICILRIQADVAPGYSLRGSDEISPGSIVTVFGFPHADYGRMVLTQQTTQVGAKVLIQSQGIKNKHFVLNTQARPGQSGGPVFFNNSIVGMLIGSYAPGGSSGISLAGVDPLTLHQTTHVISAEYIKEMLM
ncbi:serine protease [Paenibacillus odorifer]|uniref:S1 family peptidase n=1 Tax=Paenibacillus odorifer TaxID=189426 RepID=UPI00096D9C9F|nr:serine protease [Paenibacillus odorifer]OME02644.1 serine protease [Paenibacillus odorifer]